MNFFLLCVFKYGLSPPVCTQNLYSESRVYTSDMVSTVCQIIPKNLAFINRLHRSVDWYLLTLFLLGLLRGSVTKI